MPIHRKMYHEAPPTTKVENRIPTLASNKIGPICFVKSFKLTCSADAKSKKLSIPCIRVVLKSMEPINVCAVVTMPSPNNPEIRTSNDTISAIAIIPIVVGNPTKR